MANPGKINKDLTRENCAPIILLQRYTTYFVLDDILTLSWQLSHTHSATMKYPFLHGTVKRRSFILVTSASHLLAQWDRLNYSGDQLTGVKTLVVSNSIALLVPHASR